jgi:hypothetical protein
VPWAGRSEDPDDPGVWAIVCFAMNVGSRNAFLAAGLREVSRPAARRVVLRLDFE